MVVILGTEAGRYLAMSDDGRLYGTVSDPLIGYITHTPYVRCTVALEVLMTGHATVAAPVCLSRR